MKRYFPRWVWLTLAVTGAVALGAVLFQFPWQTTLQALASVNGGLLVAALLINLLSPLARGWAWYLLLRPVAWTRWWVAEEATFIGTAVSSISVGVSGEAARISLVMQRDQVELRPAVLSVAWSRAVEALALALLLVLAPLVLELPAPLRGLQIGAGVVLAAVLLLPRLPDQRWLDRLPTALRAAGRDVAAMSWGSRLIAPLVLGLASWAAEWATYDLCFRAVHIPMTYAASFTALIAANVGGLLRVTPANVGVMQAALVGALVPFGVSAEQAIAGGVALQAIEVLPILAIALAFAGRAGLARLISPPEARAPV